MNLLVQYGKQAQVLTEQELGDTVRGVLNTVVKNRGSPKLSVK